MNRKQRRAGAKQPPAGDVSALFERAAGLHRAGQWDQAEPLYRRVVAQLPAHAEALHLLGLLEFQSGRAEAAAATIGAAIALDGSCAAFHTNRGLALAARGRWAEAVECQRRAISLAPDAPEPHHNLGHALRELGDWPEAAACFRRALALKPDYAEAHGGLGWVLHKLGELDQAAACYLAALALRPTFTGALTNLGVALQDMGRIDEAIACYGEALRLSPAHPDALTALGAALQQQGRLDQAIERYGEALRASPEHPDANTNLAMALLARGDLAEGWRRYEGRWRTPQRIKARRDFPQPQWAGEDGNGGTLLIHAEQGYGDTIQFCRFAAPAAARGWRVILEVQPPLVRLLDGLEGVERVIARGEALPAFDRHCPTLSLPLALDIELDSIAAPSPYLWADPTEIARWRARLGERAGRRIGLVWAGNPRAHSPQLAAVDRRRSMDPEHLLALSGLADTHFVSLQKDGPPPPAGFPLTDPMAEMADFAATAALIGALDLVVSVDTAVAHLAAALGKPVWLLDRFDSCWRWLRDRDDSPWYPTLRLFRQTRPGDWPGVVDRVKAALTSMP